MKIDNISEKEYDPIYSLKYNKWIKYYKKLLLVNSIICVIIISTTNIHNSLELIIFYVFLSMLILHIFGMIFSFIYWNDLLKCKNGEAKYLKKYYPEIWTKINPYGHIFSRWEYLKYYFGKYIPKNSDIIIDNIRNENKKQKIFILPVLLTIIFIILGIIVA